MANNGFTHADFDPPLDFPLAQEWVKARGKYTIRQEWLPACGYVVSRDGTPTNMFFIYFDLTCSVGFLEWAITPPNQALTLSFAAWDYSLAFPVRKAMFKHKATTLLTRSPKGMVRMLLRTPGWQADDRPLFSTSYHFTAEDLLNAPL